jgi:hypothetical protein
MRGMANKASFAPVFGKVGAGATAKMKRKEP